MMAGEALEDWHGSVSISVLLLSCKLLAEGIVDWAAIPQKPRAIRAHYFQRLLASKYYNNILTLSGIHSGRDICIYVQAQTVLTKECEALSYLSACSWETITEKTSY